MRILILLAFYSKIIWALEYDIHSCVRALQSRAELILTSYTHSKYSTKETYDQLIGLVPGAATAPVTGASWVYRSVLTNVFHYSGYNVHTYSVRSQSGNPQFRRSDLVIEGKHITHEYELFGTDLELDRSTSPDFQSDRLGELTSSISEDLPDYRRRMERDVELATEDMKLRQGYDVTNLRRLAPKYLEQSDLVEVRDSRNEVIITFRLIHAPYGAIQNSILNPNSPYLKYGNFGPTVAAKLFPAVDFSLFNSWLTSKPNTYRAFPVASPNLERVARVQGRESLIDPYFTSLQNNGLERGASGLSRLMMEEILSHELVSLYGGPLLPRPTLYYAEDGVHSYHAGMITEWGNFFIKRGTDPDVLIDGLMRVLGLVFDSRLSMNFNRMGQKHYTYGGVKGVALFSRFGFKKDAPQSFPDPLSGSGKPWWVLSATSQDILEALKHLRGMGSAEKKEFLNDLMSTFSYNAGF